MNDWGARSWRWVMGWRDRWRRTRELPADYEALAREFAQLTARCLESEQQLNIQRKVAYEQALDIQRYERERHSMLHGELPGLTPGEGERLALLAEECGEALRAIGKIQRYGFESSSPYTTAARTNRGDLERELGSLRAVIGLLIDAHDVELRELQSWQRTKKSAFAKWTLYQECSLPREEQLTMMRGIQERTRGIER